MIQVTGIHIYPVKSCRGISLTRARITATGFEHDREWMVTTPEGKFVTQRERPLLAQIETTLTAEHLVLRKPKGAELTVPLDMSGRETQVTVWGDRCVGLDAGDHAAEWFSAHLGRPVRLVRFDARQKRRSDEKWTREIEALNQFADGFPWLLTSEATLQDLNSRLQTPLPMNRFRPNIVVAGLPALGEDDVYEYSFGDVRLRAVKPCARCAITTTNQITGERNSDEPLRTLKEYRFSRALRGVIFGQNMVLVSGVGSELAVGQQLEITRVPENSVE